MSAASRDSCGHAISEKNEEVLIRVRSRRTLSLAISSAVRAGGSAMTKVAESLKAAEQKERSRPYGNGIYQIHVLFNMAIALTVYTMHYESFKLTAGVMDHWCKRPDSFANLSVADWKDLAIPLDDRGEFSRCSVRDPPNASAEASVVQCTSWEFDLDQFGNNIVSEWHLVCDRHWLIEVPRLLWTFACLVSLLAFGALADRVGRKTVVFIAIPVVLIAGAGSSVPRDFQFFVVVRTVVSAATSALVPPTIAVFFEVTPDSRIPAYFMVGTLIPIVIIPNTLFIAQLYRAGWAALQLFLMIPTCLLVLLYYSLDESPAWLSAKGRVKEAELVALRAASLNKVPLQLCREVLAQDHLEAQANKRDAAENFGLCGSYLRARTVLLAYMWTAISYAYDTFVVNNGVPVSDVTTAAGYAVSLTSCILALPCVVRFGLRNIVAASGAIFSVSLTALAIVHREGQSLVDSGLVVLMYASGSICFTLFGPLSWGAYPVLIHCRAVGFLLVFNRLGDTIGQMSTALLDGRHTDWRLAVAALVASLFVVGVLVLPYEYDWVLQGRCASAIPRMLASVQDSKAVMQDTLVPLPRHPVKRAMTSEPDKTSLNLDQISVHSIQKSVTISLG